MSMKDSENTNVMSVAKITHIIAVHETKRFHRDQCGKIFTRG